MGDAGRANVRRGTLSAKVLRADGSVERDLGVISEATLPYRSEASRRHIRIVLGAIAVAVLILGAWLGWLVWTLASLLIFGLVTNAGVAFEAATFAGGTSTSAFNYHDSGTGVTAAAVTDTALQTPTGNARVSGVQTTPGSTNVYETIATLSYSSSFAITEWGVFSASSSGTLWDHRVFSAINVVNGNAITFTYQLTIPSGGT